MKTAIRYLGMLSVVALVAAAAACGDDSGDGDASPTASAQESTATANATSDASISIIEPAEGWVAGASHIDVRVAITGFTLDGTTIGQPAADNPGVGHWHVYVDGNYAGLSVSDVVSLPNDAMPAIDAGPHEIRVQLHNTDHTPLAPEAIASIDVDVPTALAYAAAPDAAPSIEIVEPADGAASEDRLEVRVAVSAVVLDGTRIGTPAEENPGVGHWHVYVDGNYAGLSVSDVISLPNDAMPSVSPGAHDVSVQLHNTDHTPLAPEQRDNVNVVFP
jgi:hypothetical protein